MVSPLAAILGMTTPPPSSKLIVSRVGIDPLVQSDSWKFKVKPNRETIFFLILGAAFIEYKLWSCRLGIFPNGKGDL